MQGSREGKVRLSTHTFAGMANALTRKEPPHDDQPELMTRAERRRAARKARAAKTWKKVAAGTVAVATLFGGMGVASTALAADRDSYQDTIGNSSFESARNQYGLTKHMKNGDRANGSLDSVKQGEAGEYAHGQRMFGLAHSAPNDHPARMDVVVQDHHAAHA